MAQRQWRSDDTSTWTNAFGNGADGAYAPSTGTDAPTDSACTGTSGTTSLTATNAAFAAGQFILIHQTQGTGAGNWELNKISVYSAGTITTSYSLINSYATGAQVIVMPQYSSGNIAGGVTLTGKSWNGTVGGITGWFSTGTTTITGNIAAGAGYCLGNHGYNSDTYQGEGTTGTGGYSTGANGNGGGGGSESSCGSGGGGGGNGTAGGGNGGAGGSEVGTIGLTTMCFGGQGGNGGRCVPGDHNRAGFGGAGAGIVIIISKNIISTGYIGLNAGGGSGPQDTGGGTGGGGAGGSCLLKGQTLTLGTNTIVAAGAGGAGTGSAGRIHADYSGSISGTTSPTIDSTQDATIVDATTSSGGYSPGFLMNFV